MGVFVTVCYSYHVGMLFLSLIMWGVMYPYRVFGDAVGF